jgi:DNA modification methylase
MARLRVAFAAITGTVPAAVALVNEGRRFVGAEIDGDLVRVSRRRVKEMLRQSKAV